jgi:X-X-X-Leu-X-X-Gly heptad repeat protein
VLVAIEDEYRAYREVIAAGLQALRSGTEVAAVGLDQLEAGVGVPRPSRW